MKKSLRMIAKRGSRWISHVRALPNQMQVAILSVRNQIHVHLISTVRALGWGGKHMCPNHGWVSYFRHEGVSILVMSTLVATRPSGSILSSESACPPKWKGIPHRYLDNITSLYVPSQTTIQNKAFAIVSFFTKKTCPILQTVAARTNSSFSLTYGQELFFLFCHLQARWWSSVSFWRNMGILCYRFFEQQ